MTTNTEQALQEWAEAATEAQLEAGPTLNDLRGAESVLADAEIVCRGPQLPYVMHAVAVSLSDLAESQAAGLLQAINAGMRDPDSGWVLTDAIDVLCEHNLLLERLARDAARVFYNHAETALRDESRAELAHPSLTGLLRLALSKHVPQHRLLSLLSEVTGNEPATALQRLPVVIGLAHDYFGEADLLDVLALLADNRGLDPATRADATFELGLAHVHTALTQHTGSAARPDLERALMRFNVVAQHHEARFDARAYAASVEAILAFNDLAEDDASAVDRLRNAVDLLESSLATLQAWNSGHHDMPWLAARGQALTAWAGLTTTLQAAAQHLFQPSWYDAAAALEELMDVYLACRAVRVYPAHADELGSLVYPTVEASFAKRAGLLHHLEQALDHDPRFVDHPDATALRDAVRQRGTTPTTGEQERLGKALANRPVLAALFADNVPALRDDLDPALLDAVEDTLQQHQHGFAQTDNPRYNQLVITLLEQLSQSPEWLPPVSTHFTILLDRVLRFLHVRFDAQADLYGTITRYLGPCPPGEDGKPQLWPEETIQDDLHQHLSIALTPGTVQREVIDIASGRTDITYTPQPGNRFVAEIKRRPSKATRIAVERDYLPQATNYTATGPPFGILIVGDHGPHTAGYTSLNDSVWITPVTRSPTETPRLMVIGVLPIGRPTPSDVTTPASERKYDRAPGGRARQEDPKRR
ncbi:hypothetical protein [Amycolatopsis sp. NPDC004625]|uniref:hypothetical protein n=1 Tax=Amycolatopsis sp. NPDC004625 TaxID=3154670 RepID=UPI0033A400EF